MSEKYEINSNNIDLVEFYKRERIENIAFIMDRKICAVVEARAAVDDSFRDLWENVSSGKLIIGKLTVPLSQYFRSCCLKRAKIGDASDIDIIKKMNRSIKGKDDRRGKKTKAILGIDPVVFNNQKVSWLICNFEQALQEGKIDERISFWHTNIRPQDQERLNYLVEKLPKPCDKVIWLYYNNWYPLENEEMKKVVSQLKKDGDDIFESFNNQKSKMSKLALLSGYKNKDVYIAKKSQCISKLKARYLEELKEMYYGQDEQY